MSTPSQPLSAREHATNLGAKGRKIAITVVALAFIMDLLDSTIVNIAIPSIQANLGASYTTIQWLVAGYALSFALLLITGGRMGDVFGYKKVFMIGMAGFTLASLFSGIAWNSEILIGARLLQGAMAALMVPQVMSLMQVMYKPSERTQVNGLFGAMAGVAASLGPVIGGILIKANIFSLDWRPIFLINVPIGIFGLFAASKYVPEGKSPHPLKLDLIGTGIIVVALSLLIFPLIQGRDLDWPTWTYYMMAASLPVLGIFAWWQRRKEARDGSPLVTPGLFKLPSFSLGLVLNVVFEAAMIGFFLTFTLALQAGLGFSVIKAALTGIPLAIGISMTFAILGQKVLPRLGRYAVSIGAIVMACGLGAVSLIFNHSGIHTSPFALAPCLILIGFGMGMIMMPVFAVVLNDVDHNHAGSASGVLSAVQQVGGAVGVAVIGVIFFGQLSHHATTSFDSVTPQLKTELATQHIPAAAQAQIIDGVKTCFSDRAEAKDSSDVPESCKQTSAASGPAATVISKSIESSAKDANAANFVHAFKTGVLYEFVLLFVVFCLSFLLPRHIKSEEELQTSELEIEAAQAV